MYAQVMLHEKGLLFLCVMMLIRYCLFAAVCLQGLNTLRQGESAEKSVQLKLMDDSAASAAYLNQGVVRFFLLGVHLQLRPTLRVSWN